MNLLSLAYQQEDRENVLRARKSGKGVLTAPFRLLKTNRLGVILTFAIYKRDLPSNAAHNERIQATDGYVFSKNKRSRHTYLVNVSLFYAN